MVAQFLNATVRFRAWHLSAPKCLCLAFIVDEMSIPILYKKKEVSSWKRWMECILYSYLFQKEHTLSHSIVHTLTGQVQPLVILAFLCYNKLLCNRWHSLEAAIRESLQWIGTQSLQIRPSPDKSLLVLLFSLETGKFCFQI